MSVNIYTRLGVGLTILTCICSLTLAEKYAEDTPKVHTQVEAAWHSYERLTVEFEDYPYFTDQDQTVPWLLVSHRARQAAAYAIWQQFPEDARRWEAAYEYLGSVDLLKSQNNMLGRYQPTSREKAVADELMRKLLDDPAAAPAMRGNALVLFNKYTWEEKQQHTENQDTAMAEAQDQLDDLVARYPEAKGLEALAKQYYQWLRNESPQEQDLQAIESWACARIDSPSEVFAQYVSGICQRSLATHQPMEMKFTAIDGRSVDLQELRGKVVLINFWGTWCAPCVNEIPLLRDLYAKYHAEGFEIIGIISEDENKEGTRTAELEEYFEENGVIWPQYFDGIFKNKWVKKFSVTGYPTEFLLNKEGVVVSNEPRGEKLEPLIRKYLLSDSDTL